MNFLEFLLTALAVVSIIDLVGWWISCRKNKEFLNLIFAMGGKYDTATTFKRMAQQFIIFVWFIWVLYRIILYIQ